MKMDNPNNWPAAGEQGSPVHRRRGFTFLELMLALTIVALIGTAVCTLVFASMNTDRFLRSTTTAQSELELAVDRITNNIREAQNGTVVIGTSVVTTLTQADVANGFPVGSTVSYSLASDPNAAGQNMLMENDQRYGNNAVLHNVKTFTVTAVSGATGLYQIDLVVGSQMTEERHFKVFNRN